MTKREAFEVWFANVGKYYNADANALQECFFYVCAWQREQDAEIVEGFDACDSKYIAEAIRNQGDE